MSAAQPVAMYAVRVPPGGILIPAAADASAMFRVTMAAIDPDAIPEYEDQSDSNKPARATLRIVRPPPGFDFDESDEEDELEDEDEDESSDEEINGGPSNPEKVKKAKVQQEDNEDVLDADMDDSDGEDEDDEDLKSAISKLLKGKARATGEDDSESSESLEMEEIVVCTLDPEKHYQQPLDLVIGEDERIFFKVTGTHTIYLTGNYLIPFDGEHSLLDSDSDEDGYDYDLSPDEDELDLMDEDDESDALDDLENPRITEVDSEEEETSKPAKKPIKGKNKRPAEDSEDEPANLDDIMAKALKPSNAAKTNGEPKLSKKQQKKLKKNNGEAVEVPVKTSEATESPGGGKPEKKVQFAKKLEQGPTPSQPKKEGEKKVELNKNQKDQKKEGAPTGALGVKNIQGVTVDDKKLGSGRAARNGDRVGMRYIGKLEDGKVFDSNKKGTPFRFKLGSGVVIKGWDIGIVGMAPGGERRITIPAHLAYGNKAQPGIPANSKLIFDVKLLEIK